MSETFDALRREVDALRSHQESVEATHRITLRDVQKEAMRLQSENDALRQQLEDQQKLNGDPMYFIKACESYRQQLAEKDAENRLLHERHRGDNKILAASQAREQQLREALTGCVCAMQDYQAGISITEMFDKNERLGRLALQSEKQDNAALSAMIAKAGEVMRERAIKAGRSVNPIYGASVAIDAIHPLPQISIDDIK